MLKDQKAEEAQNGREGTNFCSLSRWPNDYKQATFLSPKPLFISALKIQVYQQWLFELFWLISESVESKACWRPFGFLIEFFFSDFSEVAQKLAVV